MSKKHPHYAGFWVRLAAGIIDVFFLIPLLLIIVLCIGVNKSDIITITSSVENYSTFINSSVGNLLNYLSYILGIVYVIYFTTRKKQATIGKRIMKIHIANPDGSKVKPLKAGLRALASLVTTATLGIGFIPVAFTKERISFHDFVCKTRVFHDKK